MTIALYAGSFDPITFGHLDIIESGCEIFNKVIIAIAYNSDKKHFIPINDRLDLIKGCTKKFSNVEVCAFEGLTVDFAKKYPDKIGAALWMKPYHESADEKTDLSEDREL